MITAWKRHAIEGLASTFSGKAQAAQATGEADLTRLHAKIGQSVVARDFFGEGLRSLDAERRRAMIEMSDRQPLIMR